MGEPIEGLIPLLKLIVGERTGASQSHMFEDLLQEATIAAWTRLNEGHSRQIAAHKARQRTVDLLRGGRMLGSQDKHGGRPNADHRTVSLVTVADDGSEEYILEPSDTRFIEWQDREASWDALRPALLTLTERQRQAVYLTYWEGLTAAEAAREMGITRQAVQQNLARALGLLRESLVV